MASRKVHITFEILGVLLGIYLIYIGGLMFGSVILGVFAIPTILLGIAGVVVDSMFIFSFID